MIPASVQPQPPTALTPPVPPPASVSLPPSQSQPTSTKRFNYFLIFIFAAVGIIVVGILIAIFTFYNTTVGSKPPQPVVFNVPASDPTPTSTPAPVYTSNPQLESTIASYETLPENAVLKDTIADIPIYETPDRPLTDDNLFTLKQILEGIPNEILDIKPKAIISTTKDAQAGSLKFNPLLAAFARGPYIYILDQTFTGPKIFNPQNKSLNISNVRKTIIHEFIHIAQYYNTSKDNLTKADPLTFAPMAMDYASAVGWVNTSQTADWPVWRLNDSEAGTSWYAKTSLIEDQAESIAFFVTGHIEEIDQKRIDWVAEWLGKTPQTYSQGVIPKFSESQKLKVELKHFSQAKVTEYQQEFPFVETFGWQTTYNQDSPNNPAKLTDYYSQVLPRRGWQGNLAKRGNGYEGEWVFSDRKKAYIMIWPAFAGTLTNIMVMEGSK